MDDKKIIDAYDSFRDGLLFMVKHMENMKSKYKIEKGDLDYVHYFLEGYYKNLCDKLG